MTALKSGDGDLRRAFDEADKDKNGVLSPDELVSLLLLVVNM